MKQRVLAAVEDLLFRSKVSETAETLGIEAWFPRNKEKLLSAIREDPPDLVVLDLASSRFEPLDLIRTLKSDDALKNVEIIGFLPHVERDLALGAREAGCDRVMARSAFTRELPTLLAGATRDRRNDGS